MTDAPHPLEAELAAHGAWARRLAAALTRDEGRADDAAQEAWLAALDRGPVTRAWLAQVVRNAVRRLGRADTRRAARERAAARGEALASAGELAGDAELARDLAAAVLALAEPYRSTLVLRFYRDLAPAEIARRQGVPAATVRSRLARGLAELRARLDERYGGREAWGAVVAPLVGRGIRGAASGAAAGGALVMAGKGKLALAAAGACVAAALVLRSGESGLGHPLAAGAGRQAEVALAAAPADAADPATVTPTADAPSAREPVAPAPTAPLGPALRVRVVDDEGAPVASASVHATPAGAYEPVLAETTTGADGRAALTFDAERARVHWSAPDRYGGHRDLGDVDAEVELVLGRPAGIAGVVRDAETGAALAGARVGAHQVAVESDAHGRYRLGGLLIGEGIVVSVGRVGYVPRDVDMLVPRSGIHPVDLELEPAMPVLVQAVDRETGEPLAGVTLARHDDGPPIATTGADGLARVEGKLGDPLGGVAVAEGFASLRWSETVRPHDAAGGEVLVQLPLARAGWIEGRVLDSAGASLADVGITARCDACFGRGSIDSSARERFAAPSYASDFAPVSSAHSDALGRYRLPVVACGHPLVLHASQRGRPSGRIDPLACPPPGASIRADVHLQEGGAIRGRATCNGQPLEAGQAVACSLAGDNLAYARLGADGRFELRDVRPGRVRLEILTPMRRTLLASVEVEVEAGRTIERDVTWTEEMGRLTGRVAAPDGAPRAAVDVVARLRSEGGGHARSFHAVTDASGAFQLAIPADGIYDVSATLGDAVRRSAEDVRAGTENLLFVLPDRVVLRLELRDADTGAPLNALHNGSTSVQWRPAGGRDTHIAEGRLDISGEIAFEVEGGDVDVLIDYSEDGYVPVVRAGIHAVAGSAPVVLRLQRGAEARIALANAPLLQHAVYLLRAGEAERIHGPLRPDDPTRTYSVNGVALRMDEPWLPPRVVSTGSSEVLAYRGLAPGRYQLRTYPDDVAFEPAWFDVPAPDGEPVRVTWRAR